MPINDSEQGLRDVVKKYPGEEYRGIYIGKNLSATRANVLNPNNTGAYVGGSSYFPRRPAFRSGDADQQTQRLDQLLASLYPVSEQGAIEITIDQAIDIIKRTSSYPNGGLWDTKRIVTAMETLKADPQYANKAYLIVRRNRNLNPQGTNRDRLNAVVAGGRGGQRGEAALANPNYPTLFMFRLNGTNWDGVPFWVPNLRFPDGRYALMFNFE